MRFSVTFPDGIKLVLLWLIFSGGGRSLAQDFNTHGPQWIYDEGYRAYKLIVQKKDFSSIDQAFDLREPALLFELYLKADGNKFGAQNHDPALADVPAIVSDEERRLLNLEVKNRSLERLRQLPGLARFIGDHIESTAETPLEDQDRFYSIKQLTILGNDDSIVQLGRFLFDDRNPDASTEGKKGHPGLYENHEIKFYMAGALISLLRNTPRVAAAIKAVPKGEPGWIERAQNWWLESPEAAPYRRKLADQGVKLPPGYPHMAEFGDVQPAVKDNSASTEQPAEPSEPPLVSQSSSQQLVWLGACVALILLVLLLTIRRR